MTGLHHREGRGRPEKLYSLAQAALGDNLSMLTDALLGVAGKKLDVAAVAERMLDAGQFAHLPIPRRLAALVEALNERGYQARWEAGAAGPRILFGRCPYWKVIENHPELCKMDEALLRNAMAQPVSALRKNESARRLCPFVFQVG